MGKNKRQSGDDDDDEEEESRIVVFGRSERHPPFADNSVKTSRYTAFSFLPLAIWQQFRKVGNVYFLVMGGLMAIGYYTAAFDTSIAPWSTLGPLAFVIAVSLTQEGYRDLERHRSDRKTNGRPCVVLRRVVEEEKEGHKPRRERDPRLNDGSDVVAKVSGADIPIAMESIPRKDVCAGDLVVVRNREMIPADLILLATSNEGGNAYIETSSIDGETNLKLRESPRLPARLPRSSSLFNSLVSDEGGAGGLPAGESESLRHAVERVARISLIGHPDGVSALRNKDPDEGTPEEGGGEAVLDAAGGAPGGIVGRIRRTFLRGKDGDEGGTNTRSRPVGEGIRYVAALTSEPPNAHVNTYTGKLTLPPERPGGRSEHAPLDAQNVLLRGAVLRNTEWVLGLAVFAGSDTKLVMNSVATPSKFSQLDVLVNRTVFMVLGIMAVCVISLGVLSFRRNGDAFDRLWYVGYNGDVDEPWPYFNLEGSRTIGPPAWKDQMPSVAQNTFMFITLLSNFIPLSLYIATEVITVMMILYIGWDLHMYHAESDTPAASRSTIVTDLGLVEYIFSDKTGTLTCNVMEFKRCSVDGHAFGMPIAKAKPQRRTGDETYPPPTEEGEEGAAGLFSDLVHPLGHLLAGGSSRTQLVEGGGDECGAEGVELEPTADDKLTFNAEMFLRVMAICHTVVVEKDDAAEEAPHEEEKGSIFSMRSSKEGGSSKSTSKTPDKSKRKNKDGAPEGYVYQAESPDEGALVSAASNEYGFQVLGRNSSGVRLSCSRPSLLEDEDVARRLRSGSVAARDLAARTFPSPPDPTAGGSSRSRYSVEEVATADHQGSLGATPRIETWPVLAVNKFDSDRKRMSVLVRSPPELGSVSMLLCKGADSSMLSKGVCEGADVLEGLEEEAETEQNASCVGALGSSALRSSAMGSIDESSEVKQDSERDSMFGTQTHPGSKFAAKGSLESVSESSEIKLLSGVNSEHNSLLGMQTHLGEFASEGLRTLVLGVKVLSDEDAEQWLTNFKEASTSVENRDKKLTAVAYEIEKGLHIVGATAIEDKLQDGVPDTIASLEKAGIKLWVLTGDKRETAIEIGYSTKVLTPEMHLAEVVDGPSQNVRARVAMELMRHIKIGNLPDYTLAALEETKGFSVKSIRNLPAFLGNWWTRTWLSWQLFFLTKVRRRFLSEDRFEDQLGDLGEAIEVLKRKADPRIQRRKVRALAREIIDSIRDDPKQAQEIDAVSEAPPTVFQRAKFARQSLQKSISMSMMSRSQMVADSTFQLETQTGSQIETPRATDSVLMKNLAFANISITNHSMFSQDGMPKHSFLPQQGSKFDEGNRTLLERMFAVDKDVREGTLSKHLNAEHMAALLERPEENDNNESIMGTALNPAMLKNIFDVSSVKRGLVVEGAALKHLLGDPVLEEMLFAVASCSESVIACRVSPIQKALLVKMVRHYVSPTPTTLAIGDGANDVGMIQEAHIGIGVSGLEGQQAVNASDFAIAQFRYLETLLLIHGRWNFRRMATAILYFFYKNSTLAISLIIYSAETLHSGTLLYDAWVLSMFNFVGGSMPITMMAIFDRDVPRDYVLRNPQLYACGPNNEFLSIRMTLRWLAITIIHALVIYYFSAPALALGGGSTSSFKGLMGNWNRDVPGDGEGGDLQVYGTTIYTQLVYVVTFKALYETRSIINGEFPTFTCRRGKGEGWPSRMGYTWVGATWISILFYIAFLYIYELIGRGGAGAFSPFVSVGQHTLNTRSISWMVSILVPTIAVIIDVTGKVFSNMFYPTQTQIHAEIAVAK